MRIEDIGLSFLPARGGSHQGKQVMAIPGESVHERMRDAVAFSHDAPVQKPCFDQQKQMRLHHAVIVSITRERANAGLLRFDENGAN